MPILTSPPSSSPLSRWISSTLSTLKSSTLSTLKSSTIPTIALFLESCRSGRDFDRLHARVLRTTGNAYSWTAAISGFVAAKNPHRAIDIYDRMRSLGFRPYKFTFVFALKACSMARDHRKGTAVHGSVVKEGLYSDDYIRSALVSLYGCCGNVVGAHRLFVEMPERNTVTWNAMISGCFVNGEVDLARNMFEEMPQRDVTAWNIVVDGYCKLGWMDLARELFEEMPERNLLSWSSMVVGYVQTGGATEALRLFQRMLHDGMRPDEVTMASALAACSQAGALDVGRWIHTYVDKNRLERDVVLGTSLVDMYAKCGCIDLARQVFDSMEHKSISTWNAMLCGLAVHGHGEDALALFERMEQAHVRPTDITFVGVLSACRHIGAVEVGQRQFQRMQEKFRITPKIEHYGCMVDLLGRAGLVCEAGELIMSMPMEPNSVVMGAFLCACKVHGDLDAGEHLVRHVRRMDLDLGDGWCYVMLSNIYASGSQWDGVARMRKLLKGRGVRKVPGCSSIEVDSAVHEFVVEDKSHPCWREVFGVISWLRTHVEVEGYVPNSTLVLYDVDEELL